MCFSPGRNKEAVASSTEERLHTYSACFIVKMCVLIRMPDLLASPRRCFCRLCSAIRAITTGPLALLFFIYFFLSAANQTPTGCTKGARQERQDSPPLCVGALIDRGGAKSGHTEGEKGPFIGNTVSDALFCARRVNKGGKKIKNNKKLRYHPLRLLKRKDKMLQKSLQTRCLPVNYCLHYPAVNMCLS